MTTPTIAELVRNGNRVRPTVVPVPDTVESLILDLLKWVGLKPRPYDEVLEAWQTSCPRLPVWEDATTEASSCVIARLEAASSFRCPLPARSTCGSTANQSYADGWAR
jgi:hypothetical protein